MSYLREMLKKRLKSNSQLTASGRLGLVRRLRLLAHRRDKEGSLRLLPLHRGRGRCGNGYVREEELSRLFADAVKRVQVPADVADQIADALRQSQADKERFHRSALLTLQHVAIQAKLDRAYEDRLSGRISEELWLRKSTEWEAELALVRRDTARHDRASQDYGATGSRILGLAKNAHDRFVSQDSSEQARLLKILLSNSAFDRGSLSVSHSKPFDLLVEGNETGNWLGIRDGIRNWLLIAA